MSLEQDVRRVRLSTGISLPYLECGDRSGTPVLLLHAWGESSRSFDRLTPMLPDAWHVVAMDQRGHGDADRPPGGYDLESLGADIEAFMDAIGLASAVLVGSSSGGYVAQRVAVDSPVRVAGLVLIGSPRTLQSSSAFVEEFDQLTDPLDDAWARKFVAGFPLLHDVPDGYYEDRVREAAQIPADVWRSSLAGLTTSRPPTETGTITAPTLILWGDRDGYLARREQRALAAAIAGSRFIAYEGVGHLVLWEQPARVAADLIAFVQGTER